MGRRASARRGAFDVSLGFIIIVIFAVVLLTLGVTWLRGVFETLNPVTFDLFSKSSDELQKTFQQSSQNFAIYPASYTLKRGESLRMCAGVRNNAPDSLDHMFVINMLPIAVSSSVLDSYPSCSRLDSCSVTDGGKTMALKDFMSKWVTYSQDEFMLKRTESVTKPVTITVPTSAPVGSYQFGIVACQTDAASGGAASASSCTQASTNIWGGSMQTVDILVKT